MSKAMARAVLTLLAGGGLCGAAQAQLPAGVDTSRIPAGIDMSRIPAGVDLSRLPAGVSPSQIPAGLDVSQFPAGMDIPAGAGAFLPQTGPGGIPAQGVAIQAGASQGSGANVLRPGGGGTRPRKRPQYGMLLDVQQIADLQLSGLGESITYTEISGTATMDVSNRRIVLSSSYRLSYRIPEIGDIEEALTHNGVARLEAKVIDDWLSLSAGGIATRSRVDPGGAAPQTNSANAKNLTQTYSGFVQPSFLHRFGELTVAAAYRYAYTKNEGRELGAGANPLANRFEDSTNQQMSGSIGMGAGSLPFGWKLTGEHAREDTSNLAKQTRSSRGIAELTLPLSGTIAAVASGGYETTEISERGALIAPLTGIPVRDDNGRFVVDPASPRVLTYDMSGFVADGGIIWRPSRRTRAEVRAGYRYGGLTITGLIEMAPSDRSGITLIVTDRIDSFGESISGGLANSPAELDLNESSDPSSAFQNCLFGKALGSGRCIGGALGQASASSYRERAVNLIFRHRMRRWDFGFSGGYTRRTYIDAPGTLFSLDGVVDQSIFSELTMSTLLGRTSGVSFSFRGNLFKNGQVGEPDVLSGSIGTNYYRTFGRGIRLKAQFTVDASKQDGNTADVAGRAELGLQYKF